MQRILKKLPKKAKYNMFITDLISAIVILAVVFIIGIFVNSFGFTPKVIKENTNYIFYIIIGWILLDMILTQVVGYKRIKYSIDEKSVEVYKGIYFISHEIVPIRRMQQININQGPINRIFKLSKIEVITSGGKVELEYIPENEVEEIADMLRDKINEFAKEKQFNIHKKNETESFVEDSIDSHINSKNFKGDTYE